MLRLSKLTDYGIVVMTCLAAEPGRTRAANEVASATGVALPTVSKLLKMLSRDGLVHSTRGVRGGYRLARLPGGISVAQIIQALEGPVALTECSSAAGMCDQESHCSVRGNWQRINAAIRLALEGVTLAEMVQSPESAPVDTTGLRLRAVKRA